MNTLFGYNFSLVHLFHSKGLPISFQQDTPYFAESTLTYYEFKLEVIATNLYFITLLLTLVLDYYFVLFFVFACQLRQVDFKAIFRLFQRLFTQCRVASSMLFLYFLFGWYDDYTLFARCLLDTEFSK